jgi:DNA repair protein RadC
MSMIPWLVEAEGGDLTAHGPVSPSTTAAATLARVTGLAPGVAADLLGRHGSLGALRHVDATTLHVTHGLTDRQTARLRAALDLATCLLLEPRAECPQIASPGDAARLLLPEMGLLEQEEMRLLLLDTKHHLLAAVPLYAGTVSECRVRVAEIFREAIRRNATAVIVAHNHPSGAVDPSPEDVRVTAEIVQAGRLLEVEVLAHRILGPDRYVSLHERGLGWEPLLPR